MNLTVDLFLRFASAATPSRLRCLVMILLGCWCTGSQAQVVQLPSFRTFGYRGSVLVPDGGTTSLGGVNRYAAGTTRRGLGPLSSRGFGAAASSSNASISATIIDHDEIDRQLLGDDLYRELHGKRSAKIGSLDEAKSLVRAARQALAQKRQSQARAAYAMAIEMLTRLAKFEAQLNASNTTTRSPVALSEQPTYLLAYAKREFQTHFPEANPSPIEPLPGSRH